MVEGSCTFCIGTEKDITKFKWYGNPEGTFEMDDQTGQRLSADVFEGQANRNFAGDVTFQQFYANKLDRAAGRIIVGAGLRHQGKILIHGSHLLFTVARRAGP